jgi:hypothetical protein
MRYAFPFLTVTTDSIVIKKYLKSARGNPVVPSFAPFVQQSLWAVHPSARVSRVSVCGIIVW